MKRNLLGILVLCIIVFTACAAQKKGHTSAAAGISYVKMVRTPCFGKCPNYSVEVYSDGLVRYTGIRFTDNMGVYEKNIGPAKAKHVLREFQTYRVDTCSSEYTMKIADLPGINYTVKSNNKTTEIRNAHFGPAFLKELGKEVDKLADVGNTWKKVSGSSEEN